MKKLLCLIIVLIITIGCNPVAVKNKKSNKSITAGKTELNVASLKTGYFSKKPLDPTEDRSKIFSVKIIAEEKEETYTQKIGMPELIDTIQYGYLLVSKEYAQEIIPLLSNAIPLSEWKDSSSYNMRPLKLSENTISIKKIEEPLSKYLITLNFTDLKVPMHTFEVSGGSTQTYSLERANISHTAFSEWKTNDDDVKYMNKVLSGKTEKINSKIIFPEGKSAYGIHNNQECYLLLFQFLYRTKNSKEELRIDMINLDDIDRISYTVNEHS